MATQIENAGQEARLRKYWIKKSNTQRSKIDLWIGKCWEKCGREKMQALMWQSPNRIQETLDVTQPCINGT